MVIAPLVSVALMSMLKIPIFCGVPEMRHSALLGVLVFLQIVLSAFGSGEVVTVSESFWS